MYPPSRFTTTSEAASRPTPSTQPAARSAGGGELPSEQRAVRQGEEDPREREEVDHVPQVDDPAADAVEVGQHPDRGRRRRRAPAGSPTSSGSRPTRIRRNITAAPRMNAVIWLRLRLDAQMPIPANPAASRPAPTYCAATVGHGMAAPKASAERDGEGERQRDPEEQHRRRDTCRAAAPARSAAAPAPPRAGRRGCPPPATAW